MKPAGIYLSIPFCRQKCSYCNFASDVHPASLLPRYLDALKTEIVHHRDLWPKAGIAAREPAPVDSIYLGGGTPGLLRPEQLKQLLETVRAQFRVEASSEITMEASPENATPENANGWAEAGVNRVSLGVQSMVPQELRAVGRAHRADTVARAFSALRSAGIENLSADLIAGLPYQTVESWRVSLRSLLDLEPSHLSVYLLEVDEDSRLGREVLAEGERYHAAAVPSEEDVAELYDVASEMLAGAGWEHYEISNYARPGRQSRHNVKYWTDHPYYGFGVEAHSYDGERRWANTDSVTAYVQEIESGHPAVVESKALSSRERMEERLFIGLRRSAGISASELDGEFAVDVQREYAGPIREFCKLGWMQSDGDRLRLTERGWLFSNEVFARLLD